MLNFLLRQELRGQTGLLREFSVSNTLFDFIWSVMRSENHMKGLSLVTNPVWAAEHRVSGSIDRNCLAIMIRLDTRAWRRGPRNLFTW